MRARVLSWSRARQFCSSPPRTRWEEFKEFASHFSPRTKPELRFDNFPRQTGHEITLGTIFGINVLVFAGWQVPQLQDLWSHWFLWSNHALKDGKWWLMITPSFSHQDIGHLVANMTFFLYLGKRLHQFMGRARFIALYLSGAVAGSIASELNPKYRGEAVAQTPARYLNILNGQPVGTAESLGASDAVMAILACWYFVFPRTQIHVFRTVSMATDFLRYCGFVRLTTFLDKYHPTCSALWFLPGVFVSDFLKVLNITPTAPASHLSIADNTNVSSHVAGFAAGTLFHVAITRPLKAQHYARNWYEVTRRMILTPMSLGLYSVAMYKLSEYQSQKQTLSAVRFLPKIEDTVATPSKSYFPFFKEVPTKKTISLKSLVTATDLCSAREAYTIYLQASQDNQKDFTFGQCDNLFREIRAAVTTTESETASDVMRSVHLREPTSEEADILQRWVAEIARNQKIKSLNWWNYAIYMLTGRI